MTWFTMRSVIFTAVGSLLLMQPFATAQRVRVDGGGVRVRAPFVRVDVGPYGGVSVRAPFAAVDVPPTDYFYSGPDYQPPVIYEHRTVLPALPDAIELAEMSDAELRRATIMISERLHNDLRRFDTGATWQRYFRLHDAVINRSTPTDIRIEATIKLLERFYKIADDSQYSMISRLPSFVAMQEALNETVARYEEGRGPRDPDTDPFVPGEQSAKPIPPQESSDVPEVEDLPLPAPQRSNSERRREPFLKPRPSR